MRGSALGTRPTSKRRNALEAQFLSTGLILSTLGRFGGLDQPPAATTITTATATPSPSPYRSAAIDITRQYNSAVSKYDHAHEEFTSSLRRADAWSMGVFRNGRVLGVGENVA